MQKHEQDRSNPDSFDSLTEWQDHQYQEGYYVGGRIPPLYQRTGSNKLGYGLIVSGLMFLTFAIAQVVIVIRDQALDMSFVISMIFLIGLGVLQLATGIRIIRR